MEDVKLHGDCKLCVYVKRHPASSGGTEQRGCPKHLSLFTETHVTNPVRALKLKNTRRKKKTLTGLLTADNHEMCKDCRC